MRLPLGRVLVAGTSMLPTLRPGDHLLVRYGGRAPRLGDVVVVDLPGRPLGVKRVVRADGDGWWVEGDSPQESTDSRTFGPVAATAVRGRVLLRYWPPRRAS